MRISVREMALVASLAIAVPALNGCGSSSVEGSGTFEDTLQGTWSACERPSGGTTSEKVFFIISGTSVTVDPYSYANGTCSGTGTSDGSYVETFLIGPSVTANLGSTPVTAYKVDILYRGATVSYQLAYVDTAATPDRLYFGDTSGSNPGTTDALRPTALDNTTYFSKQ